MKKILVIYIHGKQANVFGAYSIPDKMDGDKIKEFVRQLDNEVAIELRPMDWLLVPEKFSSIEMFHILDTESTT